MAITSINGVSWDNLSSIAGIAKASITNIGGVIPTPSVSCTTEQFMYGRDLNEACNGRFAFYEFDSIDGVIYNSGQCGVQTAAPGYYQYYADNMVYYFDGNSLSLVGPCKGGK